MGKFVVSTTNKRTLALAIIGAAAVIGEPARATSLVLACSGTISDISTDARGVSASAPATKKTELSVIVDFGQRTITGLWDDIRDSRGALVVTAFDANSVTFAGFRDYSGPDMIDGRIDRITGKIDAREQKRWPAGNMTYTNWDLHCRSAKPQF